MPTVEHDSLNDMLYITIPSTDTDGNYINPEHITYRVFLTENLTGSPRKL